MPSYRRSLAVGLILGLALGALVGAGAVLAQGGPASQARLGGEISTTPVRAVGAPGSESAVAAGASGVAAGSPGAVAGGSAVTGRGSVAVGSAVTGAAIAPYPYFAGSPGLAPDNTIVATGNGQSVVPSESDRSSAEQSAIKSAIADARAQADAAAYAAGLSISGVLSVSVSVSPDYGVVPMAATGSGPIACPAVPPSVKGTSPTVPEPICPPYPQTQTVSASATVAYRVS